MDAELFGGEVEVEDLVGGGGEELDELGGGFGGGGWWWGMVVGGVGALGLVKCYSVNCMAVEMFCTVVVSDSFMYGGVVKA